jgi:hypothetical protein
MPVSIDFSKYPSGSQARAPSLQVPFTELPQRETLLPISFRIPRQEPPNSAPAKKDAPFPEPSKYLLKFPVSRIPRFPNGFLRREASVSISFFYTFPSKSPVNEPPSMFPSRVPMEREVSYPEPMVYSSIHLLIYICLIPQ